jgi:fused signal recognition particle receptor
MTLFSKFKGALVKSSKKITNSLVDLFQKGNKITAHTLEEFEELLLMTDMGPQVAQLLIDKLQSKKFPEISPEIIAAFLKEEMLTLLEGSVKKLDFNKKAKVIFLCGVNGTGKTTTAGKLALNFQKEGKKVLLGACDTFRAAAVEQLEVWAHRLGITLIRGEAKADPASVCYKSLEEGQKNNYDLIILDTAGRLHNNKDLMLELEKSARVLKKLDPEAPEEVFLVLDSTTGQNASNQIEQFKAIVPITGLIFTKLDSSAKGGMILGAYHKYKIPLYAIGVGEGAEDLVPFDPEAFIAGLLS